MILLLSTLLLNGLATGGAIGTFVSYYHFHSSLILAIPIFLERNSTDDTPSYANAYANRYANVHLSALHQIYKTVDFPMFL